VGHESKFITLTRPIRSGTAAASEDEREGRLVRRGGLIGGGCRSSWPGRGKPDARESAPGRGARQGEGCGPPIGEGGRCSSAAAVIDQVQFAPGARLELAKIGSREEDPFSRATC
jgi:hypothetical protein